MPKMILNPSDEVLSTLDSFSKIRVALIPCVSSLPLREVFFIETEIIMDNESLIEPLNFDNSNKNELSYEVSSYL